MPDDKKLQVLLSSIKDLYAEKKEKQESTSFLIWGGNRAGKTHSLTTARRPILIHSFDPGGLDLPIMQRGIKEGWILPEPFEEGTPRRLIPNSKAAVELENAVYTRWARRFLDELNAGLFNNIGTYVIDSGTSLAEATLAQVAVQFARKEGAPDPKDYKFAKKRLYDFIHTVAAELPCDFIMTAHIYSFTNPNTEKTEKTISLFQKARRDLNNAIHEIYVAQSERTSKGQKYYWQTAPSLEFPEDVGSRLSDGKLSFKEEPDFKKILKKLGRRHEDAPPLGG